MITKLSKFLVFENKLLYATKDFIGFGPAISKALAYGEYNFGRKVTLQEFEMTGSFFSVMLTSFKAAGPLRGYKRIEIIKNGQTIIRYENGGKGHGSNYSEGSYFLIENSNAYLVANGHSMKNYSTNKIYHDLDGDSYYFFWFRDITIPTIKQTLVNYDSLQRKEIYTRREIEHLRQIEWHANTSFNNHKVIISESSIPGFWRTYWSTENEREEFRKYEQIKELNETKIVVDGIDQLTER